MSYKIIWAICSGGGQAAEYGNVQEIWSVDALVNKQKVLAEKVEIREGNQNRRFLRTL